MGEILFRRMTKCSEDCARAQARIDAAERSDGEDARRSHFTAFEGCLIALPMLQIISARLLSLALRHGASSALTPKPQRTLSPLISRRVAFVACSTMSSSWLLAVLLLKGCSATWHLALVREHRTDALHCTASRGNPFSRTWLGRGLRVVRPSCDALHSPPSCAGFRKSESLLSGARFTPGRLSQASLRGGCFHPLAPVLAGLLQVGDAAGIKADPFGHPTFCTLFQSTFLSTLLALVTRPST